jgi:hypothetical protein
MAAAARSIVTVGETSPRHVTTLSIPLSPNYRLQSIRTRLPSTPGHIRAREMLPLKSIARGAKARESARAAIATISAPRLASVSVLA